MILTLAFGSVAGRSETICWDELIFTSRKGCEVSLVWAGERMGEDYAEACDKHSDCG